MIARLNDTVAQHGEGTAKVLKNLSALVTLADEDRRAVDELASAALALTRDAAALRQSLEQFRM
jgi:methyl-accepting chemotaxis protein